MKILIAEDDESTRQVLVDLLSESGYDVVTANDGLAALDILYGDDPPSLAILDWRMPGEDGAEVCRKVRRSGRPYIYVLMLTVKDKTEDLVVAMDAGADDYIRKPADPSELCARVRAGERIMRHHEELRLQASIDDLTGLLNRRTIRLQVGADVRHYERNGVGVSLILVDIDRFKQVNDRHGHSVGDAVLREVSKRLAANIRAQDGIGRYGGDEFLIVLPSSDTVIALEVAERVRCSVAKTPVHTSAGPIDVTASLGVAVLDDEQSLNMDSLIRAADQALYRAKRAGRNCVEGPRPHMQQNDRSARSA
ncbi:MAG: diguanylate cyclase [Burkholderiales bacterium]